MSEHSFIEYVLKLIVSELGPVGLLVIGLYYVLGQHMKKISRCLEQINHNSNKIIEVLEHCVDRICDKLNGKN